MNIIAERLRIGMELRGLRQNDLVDLTGISKGAVSSYLSGRYVPKQNNIDLLADALRVNPSWLAGHDAPMEVIDFVADSAKISTFPSDMTDEIRYYYGRLTSANRNNADRYIKNLYDIQSMQEENDLLLNAAHQRTDIPVTEEMCEYDNTIMNDENF